MIKVETRERSKAEIFVKYRKFFKNCTALIYIEIARFMTIRSKILRFRFSSFESLRFFAAHRSR